MGHTGPFRGNRWPWWMIKPPGKPGPPIFLPKQPEWTPMDMGTWPWFTNASARGRSSSAQARDLLRIAASRLLLRVALKAVHGLIPGPRAEDPGQVRRDFAGESSQCVHAQSSPYVSRQSILSHQWNHPPCSDRTALCSEPNREQRTSGVSC